MNPQEQNNQPGVVTPSPAETTPPTTPSATGIGPTDVPTAPSTVPTPPPAPKKSKKGLIIALVVLLVLIAGAAAYFLVFAKSDTVKDNTQTSTLEDNEQSVDTESELVEYSISDGPITIKFTHPKDWKLEESGDLGSDNELGTKNVTLTSSKGNILMLTQDGYGGSGCFEADTVTLIKRYTTNTEDLNFIAFTTSGDSTPGFAPEFFVDGDSFSSQERKDAKENDTFQACIFPGVILDNTSTDGQYGFALMVQRKGEEYYEDVTYDQVKDDAEFITVLQSLELSGNN